MRFPVVLLLILAAAITASANPTPIPPTLLGPQQVSFPSNFNTAFPYLLCNGNLCGGSFRADIGTGAIEVHDATLWCSDYQLDITNGKTYEANIVRLNAPNSTLDNASQVRYGTTNSGLPPWVVDLSTYNAALTYDTALRFKLAATLIMKYQDLSHTGDYSQPVSNYTSPSNATAQRNASIQYAVWDIMENTIYDSSPPNLSALLTNVQVPSGYSNWIDYAIKNYSKVDFNQWAVVSGIYDNGLLDPRTTNNMTQTFLVRVTPEPGFYGLLFLGMGMLFWIQIARRRRKIEPIATERQLDTRSCA